MNGKYTGSMEFTVTASEDGALIDSLFGGAVRRRMVREEKEIYGAWRAGYDFLYLVWQIDREQFRMERTYVPSDDPDHAFRHSSCERYDLREEALSDEARQHLEDYEP